MSREAYDPRHRHYRHTLGGLCRRSNQALEEPAVKRGHHQNTKRQRRADFELACRVHGRAAFKNVGPIEIRHQKRKGKAK